MEYTKLELIDVESAGRFQNVRRYRYSQVEVNVKRRDGAYLHRRHSLLHMLRVRLQHTIEDADLVVP
jgi:hypothetical protein